MRPTTSVIIPVHDRADTVLRAVRSALAQTVPPEEVVVVDDASTDGTPDAVLALGAPCVRVVRHAERRGAATARNTGLEAATGAVVAFLDSDDEWAPTRLERQVPAHPGAGLLACGFVVRTASRTIRARPGCFRRGPAHRRFLRLHGGPITTSCLMVDRRTATERTRFLDGLPALQDLDFAIRATAVAPFAFTDDVLVTKHSGRDDRVFTTPNEVAARRLLLEDHRDALEADPVAAAMHHVALARALSALGGGSDACTDADEVDAHLASARRLWPGPVTTAVQKAWARGGPRGLRVACQVLWFVAQDPAGRACDTMRRTAGSA